jgi:hypothetical protein
MTSVSGCFRIFSSARKGPVRIRSEPLLNVVRIFFGHKPGCTYSCWNWDGTGYWIVHICFAHFAAYRSVEARGVYSNRFSNPSQLSINGGIFWIVGLLRTAVYVQLEIGKGKAQWWMIHVCLWYDGVRGRSIKQKKSVRIRPEPCSSLLVVEQNQTARDSIQVEIHLWKVQWWCSSQAWTMSHNVERYFLGGLEHTLFCASLKWSTERVGDGWFAFRLLLLARPLGVNRRRLLDIKPESRTVLNSEYLWPLNCSI